MLTLNIDTNKVIYLQVYQQLSELIHQGQLLAGDRLPSTRALSLKAGISRNVVIMAFDQLELEGLIEIKPGAGAYVKTTAAQGNELKTWPVLATISASQTLGLSSFAKQSLVLEQEKSLQWGFGASDVKVDFRYGVPYCGPDLKEHLRIAFKHATQSLHSTYTSIHDYGDPRGDDSLREEISRYLAKSRAFSCSAENIIVTNGSQQAFDLIARALINKGDNVIIEDPRYLGFERVIKMYQGNISYVPVDHEGLDTEQLPRKKTHKLIYVTPSHHFPTGAVMSYARRQALLLYSQKQASYIVEDDYDSEYQFGSRPVAPLASLNDERVIYVGSFSKLLSPGLRTGYMVLPSSLVKPIVLLKRYMDLGCNRMVQSAIAELLVSGKFGKHLRKTKAHLNTNRKVLIKALNDRLISPFEVLGTQAGMHLHAHFFNYDSKDFRALRQKASANGVQIYSANNLYSTMPREMNLLFGYGHLQPDEIEVGAQLLADCKL